MQPTNRNRSNHRSITLGIVIAFVVLLLLAAPAVAANTAEYTVSPDGKTVSVVVTLENQESFDIKNAGLFGDSAIKDVTNLKLVRSDGTVVTPKNNNGTYTFDKGNYTLTYTAPIENYTIYGKYPAKYNVKIIIPAPYDTGHVILGTVQNNGQITKEGTNTVVTYKDTDKVQVTFYENIRVTILYIFLAVWGAVCIGILIWYLHIRKRNRQIKQYD